ncbi:hypothetical protein PC9H_006603 [Pleurotus ostreatus]|uniref:Wax synthase domain-containing protein n=1 Tax=Pleurotus ostreatus TaxID=5322 RepID=A0A8H6ZX98_PLEOS|nr:uncharacterized protein PC9H_006603 [Pleurotus ostreatus]KAF7430888.1 hypothetical protein PC9H_006603 [Pleurotus ostreatus]KAJ8695257.1 hypothetical protein PTI98_007867 [Pleurotus ostreatus]
MAGMLFLTLQSLGLVPGVTYLVTAIGVLLPSRILRTSAFLVNSVIVYYSIRSTATNVPAHDYSVGSGYITLLIHSSVLLLLSSPRSDFRQLNQAEPTTTLSWLQWAFALLTSPRLIGWTTGKDKEGVRNCPPQSSAHLAPPRPSLTEQFKTVGNRVAVLATVLAILNTRTFRLNVEGGPRLVDLPWLWKSVYVVICGCGTYAVIDVSHRLWMLLLVLARVRQPSDFHPVFGSMADAYTLQRFWGRSWHQIHRRKFLAHAEFITRDLLGLPEGSTSAAIIKLYTSFFVSALIHAGGDYACLRGSSVVKTNYFGGGGSIPFFLLQALAIHVESMVIAGFRRMERAWFNQGMKEIRGRKALKLIGYLWVWVWMTWTVPIALGPLLEGGLASITVY